MDNEQPLLSSAHPNIHRDEAGRRLHRLHGLYGWLRQLVRVAFFVLEQQSCAARFAHFPCQQHRRRQPFLRLSADEHCYCHGSKPRSGRGDRQGPRRCGLQRDRQLCGVLGGSRRGSEGHPGGRRQGRGREGGRLQVGRSDGALQGIRGGFPRGEYRGGREQRRHHAGHPGHADEARPVAIGDRPEPERGVLRLPGGVQAHAQAAQGPHRQHIVHRGSHWQPRTSQLCRCKGWRDRHDDVHGERVRGARRDRERGVPGLHRERHDRRAGPRRHQEDDPPRQARKAGRDRGDGQVHRHGGQRGVHHGPELHRGRRNGHRRMKERA